jgi:CheY-like chemotaxis protein
MTPTTTAKRVLIVDDSPGVLSVLRDFFAVLQHGHTYEVTTTDSASEAFQILRREHFDLVLLDIVIPATSRHWLADDSLSVGLLNRLRDLGVTEPVIAMTAGMTNVKPADALGAGAVGWIEKPINLRELEAAVAHALGSSDVTA